MLNMLNPFKINTAPFEIALMEAEASKYLIKDSVTGLVYGHKAKGPYSSTRNEAIKYLLGTKQIEYNHETPTAVCYTVVSKAMFWS
jgi:hypothetical protein